MLLSRINQHQSVSLQPHTALAHHRASALSGIRLIMRYFHFCLSMPLPLFAFCLDCTCTHFLCSNQFSLTRTTLDSGLWQVEMILHSRTGAPCVSVSAIMEVGSVFSGAAHWLQLLRHRLGTSGHQGTIIGVALLLVWQSIATETHPRSPLKQMHSIEACRCLY